MTATTPNKLLITPLMVSVHRTGDNPVHGEGAIKVTVDDEGGGPFIVLDSNSGMEDGLRIDMDELEAVTVAARQLISGAEKTERKRNDNPRRNGRTRRDAQVGVTQSQEESHGDGEPRVR